MKKAFSGRRKKWFGRLFWPAALLLALALRAILPAQVVEVGYSQGIFLSIRLVQGALSSLFPFPEIYLLLLLMAVWLVWKRNFWSLVSLVFFLAFAFLFLWGFNYQRTPFAQKAGLDTRPLDMTALEDEFDLATRQVLDSRKALAWPMDLPVVHFYSAAYLESALALRVKEVIRSWDYPAAGRVRARLVYPKGILLRFSSSGVYLPWTGEGHVDAGLHPLNWPFVLAHEMSHGYGMADEGVCNFLAYQVCSGHPDPYVRYAGALYYWRYAAYEMMRFCPLETQAIIEVLPEGIRRDLADIRAYSNRYPDIIPQWRDVVYDSFLKSQGLSQGVLSYNQVLVLAHAWRTREEPSY